MYNWVGNVVSLDCYIEGLNHDYSYDDLNRLKSALQSGNFSLTYAYDSTGNILQVNDTVAGYSTHYVYGSSGAGPHAVTFKE